MASDGSDCFQRFGYQDFKHIVSANSHPPICPIDGCSTTPVTISYGKSNLPFCPTHGIRLHAKTFVYWNGKDRKDEARLRNFAVLPKLALRIALSSVEKAESHRLGYEMSEDALTWNVFVSLGQARKLRKTVKFLTGRDVNGEPRLYLWGSLVDVTSSKPTTGYFEPLRYARNQLEQGIAHFRTEPDAMLVSDDCVICVEAKFGSGNTLAHVERTVKEGQKPVDREGLLKRYFDQYHEPPDIRRIIDRNVISAAETLHSQLFRNIIFASAIAKGGDWHVVNLVSETQWRKFGKESKQCSFLNPEKDIRSYLRHAYQQCFTFRTWEQLHGELIKDDPELGDLNTYLSTKSAHYSQAFDLRVRRQLQQPYVEQSPP